MDPDFFAPTPVQPTAVVRPLATAAGPTVRPVRSSGWSMGTVAAVAGGLAMLLLLVIGFVVLAKGDKHTPGTNALRPIGAATKVRLESELRSATAAQTMYLAEHGRYAATQQELATTGFAASPTADVSIVGVSAQDFCMSAADRAGKTRVYYSRSGGMSSTPCSAG